MKKLYDNCCNFWQENGLLLICLWLLIMLIMSIIISESSK